MKVFGPPELAKYQKLLISMKAFSFQEDARNCIPYCLFVAAMLSGLEQGRTSFKELGRKQFEQDLCSLLTNICTSCTLKLYETRFIGNRSKKQIL